ncbi:MAG TPA: hypothetical protein VMZ01_01980 [Aestuariivirga sp.]|nr:hypothetical protein [Aestuariivirga sp.]
MGFGERFWYWRGASGRNYIHSIYRPDACPPLPGAVYVAVRCRGEERQAMATGRFPNFWEGSMIDLAFLMKGVEADEIHVHLLARSDHEASAVSNDLGQAMREAARGYSALIAA